MTISSKKNTLVESLISFTRQQSIKAAEINDYLKAINSEPLSQGRKLYDILMRNNVSFDSLQAVLPKLRKFIETNRMEEEVIEEAEIQIKYKGYIEREKIHCRKATSARKHTNSRGFRLSLDEFPDYRGPAKTIPNSA